MIPIRRRLYQSQPGFTPRQLFAALQGAWLEPIVGNIWQESAGINPTTTGGQTIGLMLDQSQGAALGAELVEQPVNFATWTATAGGTPTNTGTAFTTFGAAGGYIKNLLTAGKNYVVSISGTTTVSGGITLRISNLSASIQISAGFGAAYFTVPAGYTYFYLRNEAGGTTSITSISIKEIAGNHASQATAANRPTYQLDSNGLPLARHDATDSLSVSLPAINVRRNLLTWSEQFDNPQWTASRSFVSINRTLAPDGTATAEKLIEDTTASNNHRIFSLATFTVATHVWSVYVKAAERVFCYLRLSNPSNQTYGAYFNLSTGSVGSASVGSNPAIMAVGNGWYRCSISGPTQAAATPYISTAILDGNESYTGDGTSGIYIWGAQLELGSVATDYQKITDWTSETYASYGSVYFATPQGMSALHGQSMGLTYTLPALSTDIYSWIVVPQRLNTALEGRLERYMLRKAGLAVPDYLTDDLGEILTDDIGDPLLAG